jgi:hypothetical protein
MPEVRRRYKLIVDSYPDLEHEVKKTLQTWYLKTKGEFKWRTSEADKVRIQQERNERHSQQHENLKNAIIDEYPEFADNRCRLYNYGKMGEVWYVEIERKFEVVVE